MPGEKQQQTYMEQCLWEAMSKMGLHQLLDLQWGIDYIADRRVMTDEDLKLQRHIEDWIEGAVRNDES